MMNFISKKFLGVMAALAIFALPALAEVGVGVDAVSKYVWRGTAVGSGVAIQPSVDLGLSSEGGLFAEGSTTLGCGGVILLLMPSMTKLILHSLRVLDLQLLALLTIISPALLERVPVIASLNLLTMVVMR